MSSHTDRLAGPSHHSHHHHGFDPHHLLEMEERRNAVMAPQKVLPEFLTRPDMTLVDIGCGAGYFAVPAGQLLTEGIVYAIDRQQDMIDMTLMRAKAAGLENVRGIVSAADALPLEDSSVDAVLLAMVYHDIEEREGMLSEIKRVLKPAASLYLVEWDRIETDFGPPMEIRITPEELSRQLSDAGFSDLAVHTSEVQPAVYFVHARP